MCFPPAIIAGAALALGGMGMQYVGQRKADKAQSRTFTREQARQKQFQGEQNARFEDSLNSSRELTDPNAVADAVAARAASYAEAAKSAAPAAEGYLPGSSSAPSIVATAAQEAGAKADANTASLGQALAQLGGFGDQLQKTNIQIGRDSQTIDQIGGFKRGSMDVLQSELDAAKQKGQTLRTLGGLAQSIGQMALSGGMGGAGGAAGAGPINISPTGTANFFNSARSPFAGLAI